MSLRFHNILFVCLNDDGAEPASLVGVMEFARLNDARLTLFDAIAPVSPIQRHLKIAGKRFDEVELVSMARHAQLSEWVARHRDVMTAAVVIGDGRRSVAAARRAREAHHDLVVVAPGADRGDLAVVRRLFRTLACPLLVLRCPPLSGDVLAAVDPDDELALNAMIVMTGAGVASIGRRHLHLVHAYEQRVLRLLRAVDVHELSESQIDSYADRAREAHRVALDELIERIGPEGEFFAHVEVGLAAEVLARLAVEESASLAVVGVAGRRTMPSALVGHTADRVLATTSISLLVVKAPGFVPVDDPADRPTANVASMSTA